MINPEYLSLARMARDRINDDDAVSTESGSDRVSIHATVEFARTITQSLPLPVLTSSLNSAQNSMATPTAGSTGIVAPK